MRKFKARWWADADWERKRYQQAIAEFNQARSDEFRQTRVEGNKRFLPLGFYEVSALKDWAASQH